METLMLQIKDKKESRLIIELLHKMNIAVQKLSKEEQEEFVFGKLIKEAVKSGEAKPSSIQKFIKKWK
ncbi:MAG: hypothetical protein JST83_02580 [Bacteroidetes bacterium]|nr:hypothetical protein [Bacteroidota bacterium]